MSVWTLDEVFNVIGSFIPEVFALAKVHYPGAVFTGARGWRPGVGREGRRHPVRRSRMSKRPSLLPNA